jgi:hypothetical protein
LRQDHLVSDSAYARWRAQPFPNSSEDDELDELNKDLAYWDAMVADAIVPMMERGAAYDAGVLDLQAGLASCRQRLVASQRSGRSDALRIHQLLAYMDLLLAANAEASGELGSAKGNAS